MALRKAIEVGDGVVTNYHRIVSVNTITNVQNTVEVASYTSQAKREEEREAVANGTAMNVYIATRYEVAEYDQEMTVAGAYEWLKANIQDFTDAEDVLE